MNLNHLEQAGTTQNKLQIPEPPVTRWTQHRTNTEKQEIYRKKLYVRNHCPIEITLAIVIVTKTTISDLCRWTHLEQYRTCNKLTQIKTLIRQYCVHNIINLQNITLQGIPDPAFLFIYFKSKSKTTFNENKGCAKLLR